LPITGYYTIMKSLKKGVGYHNGGFMRGIAFIGGEGPVPARGKVLAAGADLIVAADSGLMAAENAGVRPHWVIGDMDSLDDPARLQGYPPDRVLRYPPDKDDTDTELALRLLWERGCDETWLIGGGGGRLDHLLAIRSLFERERTPDRWFTAAEDLYCLGAGDVFSPEEEPGQHLVSVFPLGKGPWEAESRGLRWPLEGLAWDRGFFGVSNRAVAGNFEIRLRRGRLLVILNRK
jgi:thiamine pyrophosphokinase